MVQEFRDTENLKENFDQNKRMRQVIEIIRNQDFCFDFFSQENNNNISHIKTFLQRTPPINKLIIRTL